jgi:O-antigen/teichoic acid export membrane protein
VALLLPHFLTRDLSVERFAAWVLMLQIAAYSGYLDFGIQTAVARYVAQAVERGDNEQRDRVISTSFVLLLSAGVLAMCLALLVIWNIHRLFHQAPMAVIGELRGGCLLLCASAAMMLPLSTFTGILIGLHRNEYPALAIGGSRLAGAVAVLIVVQYTHSLVWLALCVAAFNVAGGFAQILMCRRLLPDMQIRTSAITRNFVRELLHYCMGLTAFNFGMLLVGGLDLIVVGYFAFSASGYYAIATTVITFMVGMSNAVYNALMAPMAVMQERKEYSRLRTLVLSTTRLSSYINLLIIFFVVFAGKTLLTAWVGATYAVHILPLVEILIWAQAIRLTGTAYSIALMATAQQQYGIAAVLAEGLTNLFASLIGAWLLGPVGVAWGTFIGAIVGVSWLIFHVMRRVREVPVEGLSFGRAAFLRPAGCFLPLLIYAAFRVHLHLGWISFVGAAMLTVFLLAWAEGFPRFLAARRLARFS